ncbi:MEG-4 (10.3) family [Schistosoma mansoni]|uniref:MEG-4 (10.3) family n=1 Tax=Schistosoma mansoni TaxID=6183 RepID=UPI00022DC8FA|nr:MEG-4 (10.3) family [Schistosoma mansoni]|eukprot:XP_018647798.1 MEG-4 (10.3) family [Schistosoma mansoni]
MNIYLIGILCIVGLIISQGSTANGSPLDDRFNDVNTINKKQFTEEDRLINSMVKGVYRRQRRINTLLRRPKSIADFFLINKPNRVPLWIVPLYYMVEKFVQIMGYLLEDDDTLELNLPKYYYDKSI